jgi:hypothetical protein
VAPGSWAEIRLERLIKQQLFGNSAERGGGRVARYFFAKYTNTGKNIPNYPKMYQIAIKSKKWPHNEPNVHKMF